MVTSKYCRAFNFSGSDKVSLHIDFVETNSAWALVSIDFIKWYEIKCQNVKSKQHLFVKNHTKIIYKQCNEISQWVGIDLLKLVVYNKQSINKENYFFWKFISIDKNFRLTK